MAIFNKSFDVKISVIFPHITKTMPSKDSQRIQETTFFKYEPQKSVAQPELLSQTFNEEEETNESRADKVLKDLEDIEGNFKRLQDQADISFKNYAYTYDPKDPANEAIANAEEAIFGTATGRITQAMYKRILNLITVVDTMLVDATIENGGTLNVVG